MNLNRKSYVMGKVFGRLNKILGNSQLHLALKSHWAMLLTASLIMIAQAALTIVAPWPIRAMIDRVVQSQGPGNIPVHASDLLGFILSTITGLMSSREFDFVYIGIGLLFLIYVSNSILLYFQTVSLAVLSQKVVLYIRENLFSQLITLPQDFFAKSRTGDLTNRISKDTMDVQDVVESSLTLFVRSLPTIIGILAVCFVLDWIYAITFVLIIPLIFWANVIFTRRTKDAVWQQKRIEGRLASDVQEAIYFHKAVATLSLEDELIVNFQQAGSQSALYGVRAGRFQGMLAASVDLLVGGATLLVLFVGILRIVHGCLTVGQLMVFLSYLNSIFKPIREIGKFTAKIASSAAAMERIEEITRINPAELGSADLPDAVTAPLFRGKIDFEGVNFAYRPDQPSLEDFTLSIAAGQRVAIVGPSGSGKSTILQLLIRLYDPGAGRINFDGIDIRGLKLASLRRQLAVVLQDSYIFNATIGENIAIGKPGASRSEIRKAAVAAGADEFIRSLPEGYDTSLGEGGAGLSGGQKRRLAIARAFLRDAPIILLDEPTTGLDSASEQAVAEAVRRLAIGRTTITVTHQLSTITDSDLIVVIANGRIAESGAHRELLQRDGDYARLWQAQTGADS